MTTESELMAHARLGGRRSLAVFRAVLDATARPGKLVELPWAGGPGVPSVVVPALALADLDVAVATLEVAQHVATSWASRLRTLTGCRVVAAAKADMVVALRPPDVDEIGTMRTGRADRPELGARLIISCTSLAEGRGPGVVVDVRGPGASHGRTVTVGGVDVAVFTALGHANRQFPAGLDSWFVTAGGQMVAIPRSTRMAIIDVDHAHQEVV